VTVAQAELAAVQTVTVAQAEPQYQVTQRQVTAETAETAETQKQVTAETVEVLMTMMAETQAT
jgi:hypothetical protein